MTEPEPALPERRRGSYDDIAGMRIFYRLAGETDERWIDWSSDRGPTIAEAIAVKAATVSKVNVGRMLAVLQSTAMLYDDPEAMQAVVWMVRKFRQGETGLRITDLAALDLMSVREDYRDAHGVFLDFVEDDPTPEQAQLAASIAADLRRHLPKMEDRHAYLAAAGLVATFSEETSAGDAAGDAAGEGPAGTTAGGDGATTRTTSKRSSASGSRSSRSRTGSAGRTSSATPPTAG